MIVSRASFTNKHMNKLHSRTHLLGQMQLSLPLSMSVCKIRRTELQKVKLRGREEQTDAELGPFTTNCVKECGYNDL